MRSLLHLDSSANHRDESVTRQLTALFAETWRAIHGSAGYRYRDLAQSPVAPLNAAYCALGRRVERCGLVAAARVPELIESAAERDQWARTRPLIDQLAAAETLLVGAPMYNYSVSASLKAWIDRVTFPGAFTDANGENMLSRTRVVVVSARGSAYGPGTPRHGQDFQTPHLRACFAKLGILDERVSFISAEHTLAGLVPRLARFESLAESSLAAARAEVTARAATPE